jgi:hypothetical protein
MTDQTAHSVTAPTSGPGSDPARRGGTIGSGFVPEEAVEGAAESASHNLTDQPHEGLVEPGGVDTEETG